MALKYSFEYRLVDTTLFVTYKGVITGKEMVEIMNKIYTLLRNNFVDKLLIDARESEVFLEFRESLDFASNHPYEFHKVNTAVVETKDKEAQFMLYETFVRNRNLNLKFFTHYQEAEQWLGI
jgi:hypothetical protein